MVQWATIRLTIILALISGWHSCQMDFVLAYTQANPKTQLYMNMPQGFAYKGSTNRYVLKLKKNLYGAKDAGRILYEHLSRLLVQRHGFTQSSVDKCVFYRNGIMLLIFVDDTICLCKNLPDQKHLEAKLKKSFEITIKGSIADFLRVKFTRLSDGCIESTKPHLIDSILKDLSTTNGKKKKTCYKKTPAKVRYILRMTSTFHLTTKHGITTLLLASSIS